MQTLVVLSHLRWSFVRQRPQHMMSRLASRYAIKFIEEPVHCEGRSHWQIRHVAPNVTVMVPHTPLPARGFDDTQQKTLLALLAQAESEQSLRGALVWLYTPMALPLAEALRPKLLIYDCMDELANFTDAPPQLREREENLLAQANLVFTGGPALYEARRHRHPHVHCLPSAVDAAHFSPENLDPSDLEAAQAEQLQQSMPRPRLGFFGVIDERMDLDLLAGLAELRPQWQIVMVGPVAKIDPASLPQRPNLHWLGMQPYARLPYLMAGWDLCLMPFALNDATAFISPTKTLEYMAGGKPVVSTPVRDVALLYGSAVLLARGVHEFVAACDEILAESPRARSARLIEMLNLVSSQSWDRCVQSVHTLIQQALKRRAEETDGLAATLAGATAERASGGPTVGAAV